MEVRPARPPERGFSGAAAPRQEKRASVSTCICAFCIYRGIPDIGGPLYVRILVYKEVSLHIGVSVEIGMIAVRQHWEAIQYTADEVRSDRGLLLEAVRQNGEALRYATEELRGDRTLALEAARLREAEGTSENGCEMLVFSGAFRRLQKI